jgi:Transposase zinc-binding domain/Putative transposase
VEISCRVYRPRRARESPLYRLVEQHLEELLRVWPTRFARQHGPLRPVVERVLRAFLACGIGYRGFARLWCPTCRTSVLCPFSCRARSFCPSCEKKRQLLWAEVQWHPHGHLILTDGGFSTDGTFHPLPAGDGEAVMKLFRKRLLARLIERHAISEDLAHKPVAWTHPGFSAHVAEAIPFEDKKAIEDVACYLVKSPLSLKKLVYLDGEKAVLYRSR